MHWDVRLNLLGMKLLRWRRRRARALCVVVGLLGDWRPRRFGRRRGVGHHGDDTQKPGLGRFESCSNGSWSSASESPLSRGSLSGRGELLWTMLHFEPCCLVIVERQLRKQSVSQKQQQPEACRLLARGNRRRPPFPGMSTTTLLGIGWV